MATTESEQFAALLRELKDRSGRSYGVLAGKLHMSTSTLHRYCNGDAVPNEYAPVERLARLCGATPRGVGRAAPAVDPGGRGPAPLARGEPGAHGRYAFRARARADFDSRRRA